LTRVIRFKQIPEIFFQSIEASELLSSMLHEFKCKMHCLVQEK
jgi:hypothetical protein